MRLKELDGVRAIAVLMVMLCHTFTAFKSPHSAFAFVPHVLVRLLGAGWLGVDLFFVLSGFLITGILLDAKRDPRYYFRNFYTKRVLRIFPLYFACIAVLSFFYRHSARYAALSAFFLGNCDVLFHVRTPHGMSMLWSLAIEEHFYLLWPGVVYITKPQQLSKIALAILITVPMLRLCAALAGADPMNIYQLSFFRFDGLAMGAWLACVVRSRSWQDTKGMTLSGTLVVICAIGTVLLIPVGILGTQSVGAFAFRYSQSTLLSASLVIAAYSLRGTVYTTPLRTRFMVRTGELSYCLYLAHVGIGDAFNKAAHLHPTPQFLTRTLFIFLVAYTVAELSFRYFESPILKLKKKFEINPSYSQVAAAKTARATSAA